VIAGLPRFPCSSSKRPLSPKGFYDATSNPINEDWSPLTGVPTGAISGLDVLDIDPAESAWLDQNFDALPLTTAHSTRRDGLHLLFRHAKGLNCSASRVAPGVDIRAGGGFVIWWPREGLPFEDRPICEWPDWLLKNPEAAE
jgi:Bifunctional DNA primase/polymerase, N-terminal